LRADTTPKKVIAHDAKGSILMVRILCVHGVGHQDTNQDWHPQWEDAIKSEIQFWNASAEVEVEFSDYDGLFNEASLSAADIARALGKLLEGGLVTDFGGLFGRTRGLTEFSDEVRWTAGMVVQWVENDDLRASCRQIVLADIQRFEPDVVCAHSLGSLICYDTFINNANAIKDRTFLSFGSQIGNHFVSGTFAAGRIVDFGDEAAWFHLYNPNDKVFTAPLSLDAANFTQVDATFGNFWQINHDAINYLTHVNARDQVWRAVAGAPVTRNMAASVKAFDAYANPPSHRALLVGINNYPDPRNRLEGCVNDVFQMSAMLQESGFAAEDIRVVLDDRATADGILERLKWLLEGVESGDQRFFFYSGHGAQLPAYAPDGKINHIDACLVPYDFKWTRETAITDDRFVNLYSQLPYDARFMIVLDSCYSGGMTRDGAAAIRGLDPPDDIRHRLLKWDAEHQMWRARTLPPANADLARSASGEQYVGASGATRRLGRAISLRTLSKRDYDRVREEQDHEGPYLPMIYEACGEQELASEYRHGVTSYGAFTFAVTNILRQYRTQAKAITFEKLLKEASKTLADLRYDQHPVLVGPRDLVRAAIPWQRARPRHRD
jgi:hypothetical protein